MYVHPEIEKDYANRAAVLAGGNAAKRSLAALIDSTVLKADTTTVNVRALCEEAVRYGFRAVCVPPCHTLLARRLMDEVGPGAPRVCGIAGFAWGYSTTETKVAETCNAVSMGADEVDFVQNDCWVREGDWAALELEYRAIVAAAEGRLVKIILETSLLSGSEIRESALRAALCGVHVIKTATGFGSRGASPDDIRIIAATVAEVKERTGGTHGIKASGGIRTTAEAMEMVRLGATRLGTSAGAAIVGGFRVSLHNQAGSLLEDGLAAIQSPLGFEHGPAPNEVGGTYAPANKLQ
jgi:deoxyribose-phosphate aldolase